MGAFMGMVIALPAFLFPFSDRFVYFPRQYGNDYEALRRSFAVEVPFQTTEGRQIAFYVPPKLARDRPPDSIWVVFGGNGSRALDWRPWIEELPSSRAGFLLIEYPGYGACEGHPSPKAILRTSQAAMFALARQLQFPPERLYRHTGVIGHSLGAGAATQLATNIEAEKLILISPFTSLEAMARRRVGWPICKLMRRRFDNRITLDELSRRPDRPRLTILHGDRDRVVPVRMGRALAQRYAGWASYHEIPGAGHRFMLYLARPQILEAMGLSPPQTVQAQQTAIQ